MPASAAVVNTTLTNYAQGYGNDMADTLADFIAPIVPTGIAQGQYKRYSDKNAFAVYDTARAIGGARQRVEFGADDPYFNLAPQALEVAIDDHERALAGDTGVINLQEAKIRTMMNAERVGHEKKVWDAIADGLSATGGVGVWSNAANDPVDDIDAQIQAIATNTGLMPNRIVFGLSAWATFRSHTLVKARQPGAELLGLSTDQASAMLLNPGIEIRVGVLPYDTTKPGKTASKANIIGDNVYIFFASDSPDTYDPSFAKTFSLDSSLVSAVKEYRDEPHASDIYAIDWTEQIVVASSLSARRITLS